MQIKLQRMNKRERSGLGKSWKGKRSEGLGMTEECKKRGLKPCQIRTFLTSCTTEGGNNDSSHICFFFKLASSLHFANS